MKFTIITIFPDLIQSITSQGVLGQACGKGLISVEAVSPRKHTSDTHQTVDDRPFGGGDGMLMLAEPLQKTFESLGVAPVSQRKAGQRVVYLSPQGMPLQEQKVKELSESDELILLCGRYAGVDQRFINAYVDEEISLGDYVLSGGELAAAVVIDAVARKVPGVLGHEASADYDSFSDGLAGLLEAPQFTRPREILGQTVPEVLLSGNHARMEAWKKAVAVLVTLKKRPDLVIQLEISKKEVENVKRVWFDLSESEKAVLGIDILTDEEIEWLIQQLT